MAHAFGGAAAPAILRNSDLDTDAVQQARIDLAACFRMAAKLGLHEGICNHLSFVVPGRDDLFLVNPYGWGFAEITASRLLVCDFHGNVVAGEGVPEATAFFIHARVHKNVPRGKACFHTHMPNATALTMLEGPPLVWAGQTALKFYGRTVVDEEYGGLALDEAEGDRIAASIGEADIVFMRNHGVMVLGPTVAEQHGGALAGLRDMHADAVGLDGPVADLHGGFPGVFVDVFPGGGRATLRPNPSCPGPAWASRRVQRRAR